MSEVEDIESDLDLLPDDEKDTGQEVDAATAVAATIFDSVPLNLSFSKAASVKAQAEMLKDVDGGQFFLVDEKDRVNSQIERQKEVDKDFFELVAQIIQDSEEKLRLEREEWAHTVSSVGGVEMTGAEWADLAKRLRNDEDLRNKLMDSLRKRGLSEEDAKARYDKITQIADIAAIPPSQRTPDQQQIIDDAEQDPDFRQDMQTVSEHMEGMKKAQEFVDKPTLEKQAAEPAVAQAQTVRPVVKGTDMGF